jgi:hypothetical protein
MANPVLQEALSVYGGSYEYRRTHVLTAAIPVAALLVMWPGESFTGYLTFAEAPVFFAFAGVGFSLALGLLAGIAGLNGINRRSFITDREWVRRTPLAVSELVRGKAIAALLHTLLLVLLPAPVVIAGGAVSGATVPESLYELALIASFALLCRFMGMGLVGLFPRRTSIATVLFWLLFLAIGFVAINRAPLLHPAVAALGTPGEAGPWHGPLPLWHEPWHTALIHLALSVLFLVLYACGILLIERRTRRHG